MYFYYPQSHLAQTLTLRRNHCDEINDKIIASQSVCRGQLTWLACLCPYVMLCHRSYFKEDYRQNQLGCLKLGQSHKTRLALTPSFLTQPFQKHSTLNTTWGPLMFKFLLATPMLLAIASLAIPSQF